MVILLPTTYFGPIEIFSAIKKSEKVLIEHHENYQKQTFRNRCMILSANGILTLTVPVKYSNTKKTKISDVRIDYSTRWQKIHFKAIESAYRKSPFYEYYIEELVFAFEKNETFLFDLNEKLFCQLLKLINLKKEFFYTKTFEESSVLEFKDYRNINSKKRNNGIENYSSYLQVFRDRFGFVPNLSILDILFNLGPESIHYL